MIDLLLANPALCACAALVLAFGGVALWEGYKGYKLQKEWDRQRAEYRQTDLDTSLDDARRRLHDLRSESSSLEDDSPRDAAKGERNA